jgi:IS30 family transposase
MAGAPRVRRQLELPFWEAVPETASGEAAGVAVGVSNRVVLRWLAESGGVRPRLDKPRRRLTYQERCRIEGLLDAGCSGRAIAAKLERPASTLSREIRRNRGRHTRAGEYRADNAQHKADRRARRPKPTKLAAHTALRQQVQDRLEEEHSPKQIAHRLVKDFPDDPEMRVTHETIYKALYVQGRGELRRDLAKRLRTGRTLRKPHRSVGERRGRIPGMVSISERPAEVEDRAVPGHWEGDLIMGSWRPTPRSGPWWNGPPAT